MRQYVFCFLFLLVALSSSVANAQNYFYPSFSEPWSFYAPSGSDPEVVFVIWGYFKSPAAGVRQRVYIELSSEPVFKPGFTGTKSFECHFTSLSFLPEFKLDWVEDFELIGDSIRRPRVLSSQCKVGATAKFTFSHGGKKYFTEVLIPFKGRRLDQFADYAIQMLDGLRFTLTDKEVLTRRVLNTKINRYIITTEWLIDGKSVFHN